MEYCLKCPECGDLSNTEVLPAIGQHLLCPFCHAKFNFGAMRLVGYSTPRGMVRYSSLDEALKVISRNSRRSKSKLAHGGVAVSSHGEVSRVRHVPSAVAVPAGQDAKKPLASANAPAAVVKPLQTAAPQKPPSPSAVTVPIRQDAEMPPTLANAPVAAVKPLQPAAPQKLPSPSAVAVSAGQDAKKPPTSVNAPAAAAKPLQPAAPLTSSGKASEKKQMVWNVSDLKISWPKPFELPEENLSASLITSIDVCPQPTDCLAPRLPTTEIIPQEDILLPQDVILPSVSDAVSVTRFDLPHGLDDDDFFIVPNKEALPILENQAT